MYPDSATMFVTIRSINFKVVFFCLGSNLLVDFIL